MLRTARVPIEHYDAASWRRVMQAQRRRDGFLLTQSLLPALRASDDASVVFTSSASAVSAAPIGSAMRHRSSPIEGFCPSLGGRTRPTRPRSCRRRESGADARTRRCAPRRIRAKTRHTVAARDANGSVSVSARPGHAAASRSSVGRRGGRRESRCNGWPYGMQFAAVLRATPDRESMPTLPRALSRAGPAASASA